MSLSNELRARVALEKHGFRNTRGLGQNFILNEELLSKILGAADVHPGDRVVEIGPGSGLMTAMLADRGADVLALEIDRKLESVLCDVLAGKTARVVFGDAAKTDIDAAAREAFGDADYRVVANLPYYAAFDILLKLLTKCRRVTSVCAMLQKEAAERMTAEMGTKEWCALSATVRYFSEVTPLMDVARDEFDPPPHVDSKFVRLDVKNIELLCAKDTEMMVKTINAAFLMRRKTILNNIKSAFALTTEQALGALERAKIDKNARGETLELSELALLSDEVYRLRVADS